jgi:hypothetical protein
MKLGKMHEKMNVRPWMFSVFMDTLCVTITHCLDLEATYEVSSAWVNLCESDACVTDWSPTTRRIDAPKSVLCACVFVRCLAADPNSGVRAARHAACLHHAHHRQKRVRGGLHGPREREEQKDRQQARQRHADHRR